MTRRVPLLPTLIVLVAAGIMVALGFWQLERRAEKEALLATYARAAAIDAETAWPREPADYAAALYRRASVTCARVEGIEEVAGRSSEGRSGWAHVARCRLADGSAAAIALGWSDRPYPPVWRGGPVTGIVASAGKGVRLVAAPAQAGLAPLAAPDPANIPNNHLSYAVQWFAFAATALVIYVLALRRRWTSPSAR